MNNKYLLDSKENKEYLKVLSDELLDFGVNFPSESGASYYLGDAGEPWKERPCETWITCRMAHVYSIGSMLGFSRGKELATKAINGLSTVLKDSVNGGWYPGIKADGQIISDKQCYAHAFVILAASSGVLAGVDGSKELLDEALKVYDDKFWDDEIGLAVDTWNTEFSKLDPYRGLNANMHTVEAFLAVADCLNDEKYRERAGRIIDHVCAWAENNYWRIPEHFDSNWNPDLECNADKKADQFKPYGATPGHGIEWARLISQWAESTYEENEKKDKYFNIAVKLYNTAIQDAWNADGAPGITYTTDWNGKPVVQDRMHWTLAEAINTSAVLYRITGEQKFVDDYYEFMEYLDTKVHDKVNGSWFHQLDSNNNLLNTVWPGKSDLYHAFQATLIPYSDISVSIASAVKRGQDKV